MGYNIFMDLVRKLFRKCQKHVIIRPLRKAIAFRKAVVFWLRHRSLRTLRHVGAVLSRPIKAAAFAVARVFARWTNTLWQAAAYWALHSGRMRLIQVTEWLQTHYRAVLRKAIVRFRAVARFVYLLSRALSYRLELGVYHLRAYADGHKLALLGGFFSACFVLVAAMVISNNMTAYEYSYNGHVLGIIKHPDEIHETISRVENEIKTENGAQIILNEEADIQLTKVIVTDTRETKIDTGEDALHNIADLEEVRVKGYELIVSGSAVGIFGSDAAAQQVLDQVRDFYLAGRPASEFKEVGFVEPTVISETAVMQSTLADAQTVYEKLVEGALEVTVYEIKTGDTAYAIARDHNIAIEQMAALNPGVDLELIHEGQQLKLEAQKAMLNLRTTETAIYEAPLPYETNYTDTGTLYQGEEIEQSPGIAGLQRVTADIVRVNGEEQGRVELASEILAPATPRQVLRGTKELPPLIGQGYFIWPASGRMTSGYGPRWGSLHRGIDIGVRYGSVYAADGGKVIFTGNRGDGYGNVVKIDHGGGRVTMYAHLSTIHVSAGQTVYQGQTIAISGNTGNTTGPHLHFEVHINGVPQNPMKYL